MLLLLYVDDLLLTSEEKLIKDSKSKLVAEFEMKDLDMMHYFLGMEVCQNLPGTREVCSRYPEEVQDDGMQGHDHYGIKPKSTEC